MRFAIDLTHQLVPGGIKNYLENVLPPLMDAATLGGHSIVGVYRTRQRDAIERTPPLRGLEKSVVGLPARLLARLENSIGYPCIESWTGAIDAYHGTHFHLPAFRSSSPNRVLTVHDLTYLRHPEYFRDSRWNDYGYKYLLPHALRRADLVLAASHSTKRDLLEYFDIPEDRIWTAAHAIDPSFGKRSEDEILSVRARYGIDRPYVIYTIGTIDHRKNLPRTLEAFARAFPNSEERPLLLLTGVGGDPSLAASLDELGLTNDVRLEKARSLADVGALLSGARWAIYPSLYEGFGFPILEAFACGVPLIASNRSSCAEVAHRAALSVDPEDIDAMAHAMTTLDSDAELRARLRSAGLERATLPEFGWSRAARQTLAAYALDEAAFRREVDPLDVDSSELSEESGTALEEVC